MSILKIAKMGHEVLRRPAEPVADPTDPEIQRLIGDMIETMIDADGAGLAAPQVHVSRRVVIFEVPDARQQASGAPPQGNGLTVLINPVIEAMSPDKELGWEGCLSVPGLRGAVPRFSQIRYRGLSESGDAIDREATGFHARVVQHECDHLDGILYPARMTDLSLLHFVSEMRFFPGVYGPEDGSHPAAETQSEPG